MGQELGQTVLHLQSPTIRSTYIRCPPASPSSSLRPELGPELGLGLRLLQLLDLLHKKHVAALQCISVKFDSCQAGLHFQKHLADVWALSFSFISIWCRE